MIVNSHAYFERIITKTAFIARFTNEEFLELLNKTKTDAEVELWYEKFKLLSNVDLDSEFVFNGLQLLLKKEIISEERFLSLKTQEILVSERPN